MFFSINFSDTCTSTGLRKGAGKFFEFSNMYPPHIFRRSGIFLDLVANNLNVYSKILSRDNSFIVNNDIRSVKVDIKTADVELLKYFSNDLTFSRTKRPCFFPIHIKVVSRTNSLIANTRFFYNRFFQLSLSDV